jgi:hypothetical protein
MLHHYAIKNLLAYTISNPKATFSKMCKDLKSKRQQEWVNLGGQLMQKDDVDMLRFDIGSGKLKSWKDIHNRYDDLWVKYIVDKQKHAFATLCELYKTENPTAAEWRSALNKAVKIQKFICDQVYCSRKKDFDNPFRHITFRNTDEMKAVFGTVEDNSFINQVRKETQDFEILVKKKKVELI